jgi:hypothetical protein
MRYSVGIQFLDNAENTMISLTKSTFASSTTPTGAVVGGLTLFNAAVASMGANFILNEGSAGFFAISGNNLVTSSPIPVGNYSVYVSAVGTKTYWEDEAWFVIAVTP